MLVVDASVIVKVFVPEVGSESALQLIRQDRSLLVPAHCFAEVGEILVRKLRSGLISSQQTERLAPFLIETFTTISLDDLLVDGMRIARTAGASVYDCLYAVSYTHLTLPTKRIV